MTLADKKSRAKAYHKAWYAKNRVRRIAQTREWQARNPERFKEIRRLSRAHHQAREYANNPSFKALTCIRSRIRAALKGIVKSEKALNLVGCSMMTLKAHIESLFLPGMNWSNHCVNGWHIDHIKPCALFDFTDPAQQKACFHYTNLQPLWALDNILKGKQYQ